MPQPQLGIFDTKATHRVFLEYSFNHAASASDLTSVLNPFKTGNGVTIVFGLSKSLAGLLSIDTPAGFGDFQPIVANGFQAPATQGDLFVWLQGDESTLFEVSFELNQKLAPLCKCLQTVNGFSYRESMDMMNFEDGSANPKGALIYPAALVAEGELGAGGSVALVQRWRHKLGDFKALSDLEQSKVIGREKHSNREYEGDEQPHNSHVSRTDVDLEGKAAKVWRRSSPYGDALENGLMFLSFACDQRRHQVQLDSMYGVEDGVTDRILQYSDAVSGAYYFVPSQAAIDQLFS